MIDDDKYIPQENEDPNVINSIINDIFEKEHCKEQTVIPSENEQIREFSWNFEEENKNREGIFKRLRENSNACEYYMWGFRYLDSLLSNIIDNCPSNDFEALKISVKESYLEIENQYIDDERKRKKCYMDIHYTIAVPSFLTPTNFIYLLSSILGIFKYDLTGLNNYSKGDKDFTASSIFCDFNTIKLLKKDIDTNYYDAVVRNENIFHTHDKEQKRDSWSNFLTLDNYPSLLAPYSSLTTEDCISCILTAVRHYAYNITKHYEIYKNAYDALGEDIIAKETEDSDGFIELRLCSIFSNMKNLKNKVQTFYDYARKKNYDFFCDDRYKDMWDDCMCNIDFLNKMAMELKPAFQLNQSNHRRINFENIF